MALHNSTNNNFTVSSKRPSDTKDDAGVLKDFTNNENEGIGGDALSNSTRSENANGPEPASLREVDDEFCNDSYDVSIGPAVVLEEHLRQSNSDTKRYIYQLNNTYYEAEVGFAAPDYWIAERTKHFAETGQYPEHTFEAAYVKSCTKAIKEGFETGQQPSTEILKHVP